MNFNESLKELAKHSELAERMAKEDTPRIVDLGFDDSTNTEQISFHPNGKCGCVRLKDERMFDIRCDHLMWAEGVLEGTESFMSGIEGKEAILIYGNHKGILRLVLLTCSDKDKKAPNVEFANLIMFNF